MKKDEIIKNQCSAKEFEERTKEQRKGHEIALFVDTKKRMYAVYSDTVAYHWFKSNPFKHGLWHVLTADRYLHADDVSKAVAEFMPK